MRRWCSITLNLLSNATWLSLTSATNIAGS